MKKLLLDECIPRKFKDHLSGHSCLTVPEAGWAGKKNGELLSLAEDAGFQVFVSLDQGIEFQQNLTGRDIRSHLALRKVKSASRSDPFGGEGFRALGKIEPGLLVRIQ